MKKVSIMSISSLPAPKSYRRDGSPLKVGLRSTDKHRDGMFLPFFGRKTTQFSICSTWCPVRRQRGVKKFECIKCYYSCRILNYPSLLTAFKPVLPSGYGSFLKKKAKKNQGIIVHLNTISLEKQVIIGYDIGWKEIHTVHLLRKRDLGIGNLDVLATNNSKRTIPVCITDCWRYLYTHKPSFGRSGPHAGGNS